VHIPSVPLVNTDEPLPKITPGFEPWLSANEAAQFLGGIHPKTLMRKARSGEVPGYLKFSRWYFLASELDRWMRQSGVICQQPIRPA